MVTIERERESDETISSLVRGSRVRSRVRNRVGGMECTREVDDRSALSTRKQIRWLYLILVERGKRPTVNVYVHMKKRHEYKRQEEHCTDYLRVFFFRSMLFIAAFAECGLIDERRPPFDDFVCRGMVSRCPIDGD